MSPGSPAISLRTALAVALFVSACSTAGSTWIAEPLPNDDWRSELLDERLPGSQARPGGPARLRSRTLGEPGAPATEPDVPGAAPQQTAGRSLGTFRNTYYDFPSETEFAGPSVALRNGQCQTIAEVPRPFFESLCVQGSGTLRTGPTVSFAKRDCSCADVCPRTGQKICFDVLDAARFPWGRGATGKPITPLLTVAVDSAVVPLGTAVYIPELAGLPRDITNGGTHDGCFVAQDRGIRVVGKHVDVFTGHSALTALWNRLVPSNRGVTVVLDHPGCLRSDTVASGRATD
ncbi:MAG TPA: 3D domain-containing protein [Polyangiaceae bacterium]